MQKEKIRVYVLARELNVDTKILLDMCKAAGYDVKNQLSNLEPEQRDAIVEVLKAGSQKAPSAAAPAKPVLPTPLPDQRNVRNLDTRPTTRPARPVDEPAPQEPPAPAPVEAVEPIASVPAADNPIAATIATPAQSKPASLPNVPTSRMLNLNRPNQARPTPPAPTPTPTEPPVADKPTPVVCGAGRGRQVNLMVFSKGDSLCLFFFGLH